jgi:hypothetical protein
MPSIFARSPYLINVSEPNQQGSKIELFFSATSVFPASPNVTLSKLVSSSTNNTTIYDVSNYCREYFNFISNTNVTTITATPTGQYYNLRIKRYKLVSGVYYLTSTNPQIDYQIFDGYGYFENNANYDLGIFHLDQQTYYYDPTKYAGKIRINSPSAVYKARYININTNLTMQTSNMAQAGVRDVPRVISSLQTIGAKVQILNTSNSVIATYFFRPISECKYTTVEIDFVNKYGAWQKEFFFKASNNTLSVENTEYNLLNTLTTVSNVTSYNLLEGQKKIFNANGKKSIKVNTGWVYENWNETLRQIMLSEVILIDNIPAKINTKSTELFKHINTKQINYTLEFEFAFDVINSII